MTITQLTNNGVSERPDISGERIVWIENGSPDKVILFDGNNSTVLPDLGINSKISPQVSEEGVFWNGYDNGWQVFFYNNTDTTQITVDLEVYDDRLSGNKIAWRSSPEWTPSGDEIEVYLYDETTQTTQQLTNNNSRESSVNISGDNVVWGAVGNTIILYDGISTTELTDNGYSPKISGDLVAWRAHGNNSTSEIYLYDDGVTELVASNDDPLWLHGLFDRNLLWSEWDGNDWEIFRYDGISTFQITDNDFNDILTPSSTNSSSGMNSSAAMDGSGDNLVWSSYVDDNWEIFWFDGTETIQITDNNIDDLNPKISGNTVVWSTKGTTTDIFKFEPDDIPEEASFLLDDFDPDLDNSQWQTISNGNVNNNFSGSGNSLYFSGGNYGGNSRFATTNSLDLSAGGFIAFDLIFGDSNNGGENADAGEDVALEYSIDDGTSWIQLGLYDTEDYTNWSTLIESIPPEAQTETTHLRWRQVKHSGSSYDNWGLDNIQILEESTNFAPTAMDAVFTLEENSPDNTILGAIAASDANTEQVLTYEIVSGNETGAFAIDSNGEIIVSDRTFLDYETDPSFDLEVEVSDNGTPSLSDTALITVDLLDVYEGEIFNSISEDFDPNINNDLWQDIGNSTINDNFSGENNSIFFTDGSYGDDSRHLTSAGVDVSNGGDITFDLIFGSSNNGGENADAGEDVILEYSIDGGIDWSEINLYDTEDYINWTTITESIPVGAQTDNTVFRWLQIQHNGSSFDNWGLDNIAIDSFSD